VRLARLYQFRNVKGCWLLTMLTFHREPRAIGDNPFSMIDL
jgi:hypothetical protein